MSDSTRKDRLLAELEVLRGLKKASTIFDFEPSGEPPDRYTVILRGKGINRDSSGKSDVEFVELHKVDLRLPYTFPDRAPDIRWLTPILHPNVSFSGYIDLRDLGLPWDKGMNLDVVCERLWDVARLAYMDMEKASNYSAKSWLEDESTLVLPVDQRPIRDKAAPSGSNVIQYQRRKDKTVSLPASQTKADVFFIGEDTPVPEVPPRRPAPPRPVRPRPSSGDDDVFFIGE